jgi:hypothetical protein
MSEKCSEPDIRPRRFNVAEVPVADIRRTATRHEKEEAPTGGTGLLNVSALGMAIVFDIDESTTFGSPPPAVEEA